MGGWFSGKPTDRECCDRSASRRLTNLIEVVRAAPAPLGGPQRLAFFISNAGRYHLNLAAAEHRKRAYRAEVNERAPSRPP